MQVEAVNMDAESVAWVEPNATTIQFSDKKRQDMHKQFQFMEPDKLVSSDDMAI